MDLLRRNDALRLNGMLTFLVDMVYHELSPNKKTTTTDNTVNGATADIAITTDGSDFYFAICAVMGFSGFCFLGLGYRKKRQDRLFHYITASVVFVACIAYCK